MIFRDQAEKYGASADGAFDWVNESGSFKEWVNRMYVLNHDPNICEDSIDTKPGSPTHGEVVRGQTGYEKYDKMYNTIYHVNRLRKTPCILVNAMDDPIATFENMFSRNDYPQYNSQNYINWV